MATKKVGSTGRFGARYGKTIRQRILAVEKRQKKKQICPYCKRPTAKRLALGIFLCKKCKSKFTGNAYDIQ